MKLNHDCVRLLLLEIESNKKIGEPLTRHNFNDNIIFDKYDFETVMYSLLKLEEAKFICCDLKFIEDRVVSWIIDDITWSGHEFLDNIRDNKTWNEVKRVVNKTSSMSLNLMGKLAFQYLSQKFNLT
ncbi:TPA: DUF2513 domain-containing protein [Staphylococcus aureus]|uniref:DUF2513 domain-containing protein n=1 Tax=Staphylococcus aureus TaxID=1280 RepID=UPI00226B1FA6|nr:DUF2513 domain-containing protein [Staphylococcus aureus]UZZ99709.1 DUF2513 domain-containing protein [Staphylococcus aureus]HCX0779109.1 DUF2513 domain-containing protein [Staphylococcus aureus]HDB6455322.1 DUF2513 domain-containing protein [Staphylococcus aureus]HDE4216412.1 DUF2513 domain-containing protein [Staphylococcus aureus]HEJ7506421.1 DUF2513 domain-containing protein [Staphylococcus aureus]